MERYHEKLKRIIDVYVKDVYLKTKDFPREEIYGLTSQLRRATLSVMLNYVEGYARGVSDKSKVYQNFMEISFGSLKESKYILYLALYLKYLNHEDYKLIIAEADEIGAMLYKIIKK